MKSVLCFLVMFTVLSAFAKPAPDFSLPTDDGQISLTQLKGQVVYLDFWASWCKPCVKSFPWMNEMKAKYGQQGVTFIAVNLDENKKMAEKFLSKVKADFTIAYDSSATTAEKYQVMGMPSAYIIGRQGQILHSHVGYIPSQKKRYEANIVDALKR